MTKIGEWLDSAEATLMAFFTKEEEALLDFMGPLLTQIKDTAIQLGKGDIEAGIKVLKDASVAAAVSAVAAPPGLKVAAAEAAFLSIAASEGVEAIHNAEAAAIKAAVAFIQTNTPVSISVPISFLQDAQKVVADFEHKIAPTPVEAPAAIEVKPAVVETPAVPVVTPPPAETPVCNVASLPLPPTPNVAPVIGMAPDPVVVTQTPVAPVTASPLIAPIIPVAITPPAPVAIPPPLPLAPVAVPPLPVAVTPAVAVPEAPANNMAPISIIGLPPNVTIIPIANT